MQPMCVSALVGAHARPKDDCSCSAGHALGGIGTPHATCYTKQAAQNKDAQ
jgi:hypothetical protein